MVATKMFAFQFFKLYFVRGIYVYVCVCIYEYVCKYTFLCTLTILDAFKVCLQVSIQTNIHKIEYTSTHTYIYDGVSKRTEFERIAAAAMRNTLRAIMAYWSAFPV